MLFFSIRSIFAGAFAFAAMASANALTLDWTHLMGQSTISFSDEAVSLLKVNGTNIIALGNTSVRTPGREFILPLTSITIGNSLKIVSGKADGSALNLRRVTFDENDAMVVSELVLSNFTVDYVNTKALADVTAKGLATVPQVPLFTIHVATPLALKYKFPLSITGHEVLDKLFLTPEVLPMLASSLGLQGDAVLDLVRNTDFGTLTQDVALRVRKPPVDKTPFVPEP